MADPNTGAVPPRPGGATPQAGQAQDPKAQAVAQQDAHARQEQARLEQEARENAVQAGAGKAATSNRPPGTRGAGRTQKDLLTIQEQAVPVAASLDPHEFATAFGRAFAEASAQIDRKRSSIEYTPELNKTVPGGRYFYDGAWRDAWNNVIPGPDEDVPVAMHAAADEDDDEE